MGVGEGLVIVGEEGGAWSWELGEGNGGLVTMNSGLRGLGKGLTRVDPGVGYQIWWWACGGLKVTGSGHVLGG